MISKDELRTQLAAPPQVLPARPSIEELIRHGRRRRLARRGAVVGSGAAVAAVALVVVPQLGAVGRPAAVQVGPAAAGSSCTLTLTGLGWFTYAPLTAPAPSAGATTVAKPAPPPDTSAVPTTASSPLAGVVLARHPDGREVCAAVPPTSAAAPANLLVEFGQTGGDGTLMIAAAGVIGQDQPPVWWWTGQLGDTGQPNGWFVVGTVPDAADRVTVSLVGGKTVDVSPVRLPGGGSVFYVDQELTRVQWSAAVPTPVPTPAPVPAPAPESDPTRVSSSSRGKSPGTTLTLTKLGPAGRGQVEASIEGSAAVGAGAVANSPVTITGEAFGSGPGSPADSPVTKITWWAGGTPHEVSQAEARVG